MNHLLRFIAHAGVASPAVSPLTVAVTGIVSGGNGYAGISYNLSGEEFKTATTTSSYDTSAGNWLDAGLSSGVWVESTITGGTLGSFNSEDAGQGVRLQLSTTRNFRMVQTVNGTSTTFATFDFYDAASGGSLIGTVDVVFSATRTA